MANYLDQCYPLWCILFLFSLYIIHSTSIQTQDVYIVYLGQNGIHPDTTVVSKYHVGLLSNVFASEVDAEQAMLYSYKHSFSGFSAKLNSTQAKTLRKMEGVISVFKSKTLQLHTTRSWDFLGLTLNTTQGITPLQLAYGDDVIVGVFDSGVWPESESFQEEACKTKPIPSHWKGKCVKGERFDPSTACNRKLIGARYYLKGFEFDHGPLNQSGNPEFASARDFLGHGTHTASTAAGSIVQNAGFGVTNRLGQGTARGGAPRARLAVYKICWGKKYQAKCSEADIMAAFDDALHDGVHVISASFGLLPPLAPFFESQADIGAFHAMQLGVTVVFSAGNDGPDPSLVQNVSPWSISVAASTVDRTFPTKILVNNSASFMGESLITREIKGKLADPLNYFFDGICQRGNIIPGRNASGKIVLCFSTIGPVPLITDAQAAVIQINGSGLIYAEPMTRQLAEIDFIPTVLIDIAQATIIKDYLAGFPTLPPVQIKPAKTQIGKGQAPTVAYFSSRGPSTLSPDFLKPDITAPGVNILAAWPTETPPTVMPTTTATVQTHVKWNIQSGTSMSCPHVSGTVALIKSVHPNWSPAAIRSALITTAETQDTSLDHILAGGSMKSSDPFDIGAGHLNPVKAIDPGLVYDMKTADYVLFLCNIGYTQDQIKMLVLTSRGSVDTTCHLKGLEFNANANINYPSITIPNLQSSLTIRRSVRNVGERRYAAYFVSVTKPDGVDVEVWPRVLIFSHFKPENSYYVTFKAVKISQGRYDFGEIVWCDGSHKVRSPLVVRVNNTENYDHDYVDAKLF